MTRRLLNFLGREDFELAPEFAGVQLDPPGACAVSRSVLSHSTLCKASRFKCFYTRLCTHIATSHYPSLEVRQPILEYSELALHHPCMVCRAPLSIGAPSSGRPEVSVQPVLQKLSAYMLMWGGKEAKHITPLPPSLLVSLACSGSETGLQHTLPHFYAQILSSGHPEFARALDWLVGTMRGNLPLLIKALLNAQATSLPRKARRDSPVPLIEKTAGDKLLPHARCVTVGAIGVLDS